MALRIAPLLVLFLLPATAQEAAPRAVLNQLLLRSYSVEVEAGEGLATVVVEETFFNPGNGIREADFFFPLPAGTAASGLQLSMGDRFYGGNLLTRDRARRIYGEITRRNRDPALLDCVSKNLYRCRVFPVPARATASVRFAYRQPLVAEAGMRRLVVPLDAARFNQRPVDDFSLSIHLKAEAGLQAIFCPTHEVKVRRVSAHEAYVEVKAKRAYLARDLVLLYAVDDAPLGAVLSSYRRPGDRGYFVMSIDAAFAREQQKKAPRDVVVAIDTSNSAGRDGVDAAAAAVADVLGGLRATDRFALMAFGTESRVLAKFRPATARTPADVRELFRKQPVAGRTRLGPAMRGAERLARKGLPGTGIILLTDGMDSGDRAHTLAVASQVAEGGHRVGLCGVGSTVDTVRLDALGDKGRGDSSYAARGGLPASVRHLLETTRLAPLTDVEVQIEGVHDLHPQKLRVLRPGDSILVAGRYARTGPVSVTVKGKVAGRPVTRTFVANLRASGGDPGVARLWAARRVGYLLDEARAASDASLHRGEILRLGRRFGIVTPHTSLLVLEQDDQRRFLKGMRRRPLLQSAGGELKPRRAYTRALPNAELADRIRSLRRCRSGAVNPFEDLLGANRLKVRRVGGRTFYRTADGTWTESDFVGKEPAEPRTVTFLSEAWLALAEGNADVAGALALGHAVLFTGPDGRPVRVVEG